MKMYLIAIVMAFIGLWISSEVQAGEACGWRISGALGAQGADAAEGNSEQSAIPSLRKCS